MYQFLFTACSTENNDDIEWKPVDVYKVGLVIAFMLSAEKPCEVSGKRDAKAVWNYSFKQNNEIVGQLGKIYEACCNMDFKKRSTAEELMSSYVYFGRNIVQRCHKSVKVSFHQQKLMYSFPYLIKRA